MTPEQIHNRFITTAARKIHRYARLFFDKHPEHFSTSAWDDVLQGEADFLAAQILDKARSYNPPEIKS